MATVSHTAPPHPQPTLAAPRRSTRSPAHAHLLTSVRQSRAYAAQHEVRVADDVCEAAHHYPTLRPIVDSFTASDGRSTPLLALSGTIPVQYKGLPYKIPVHLWVMPYHPVGPPLAFVVPTRAMVLRNRHPHVDASNGLVYMPYLSEWNEATSSVIGLVRALIKAFETKPPVYAKLPPPLVAAPPQQQGAPPPLRTSKAQSFNQKLHRIPDRELRSRLVAYLSTQAHAALRKTALDKSRDVVLVRDTSARLLKAQQDKLSKDGREHEDLSITLAEVSSKVEDLTNWHAWHPPSEGVDIDADTKPRHVLREQFMAYKARDAALADALDLVDGAIAKRKISVDEYIRTVRSIAREQFYERLGMARTRKRLGELKGDAKRIEEQLSESRD